jgi:hypothetical protein
MDPRGHIYELTDEERESLLRPLPEVPEDEQENAATVREDVARLDGYLKARAEADAPKRGKGANKDLAG